MNLTALDSKKGHSGFDFGQNLEKYLVASNVICPERKLPSSRSPRYIPPFVVVNHPFRHISAKPIILNGKIGYIHKRFVAQR